MKRTEDRCGSTYVSLEGHTQREPSPRDHIAYDFPLRETSRTEESTEGRKRLSGSLGWRAAWRVVDPDLMRGFFWRR